MVRSLVFRTYPVNKSVRYSISLFLTGIFLFFVSLKYNEIKFTETLISSIGTVLIVASIYIFPFIDADKFDNFLIKFLKYLFLLCICISCNVFWFNTVVLQASNFLYSFFLTMLEIIILVPTVNFTIQPIFFVCISISKKLKETSRNSEISELWTNTKILLANIGIIISFLFSLFSLINTVNNFF